MIRVERKDEPDGFNEQVRVPGKDYMAKNPGKEPPDYWKNCKSDLYKAYNGYCAYTTFRINGRLNAVVDHFLPRSHHPEQLYEWSNYRLSSFHINSVKKDHEPIIDPFELPENAFRLADDMRIEVNPEAFSDEEGRALAHKTLQILRLNRPEWLADRAEMIDEALRLKNEAEEGDDAYEHLISANLYKQSRFLHQEAVRKGYVTPNIRQC